MDAPNKGYILLMISECDAFVLNQEAVQYTHTHTHTHIHTQIEGFLIASACIIHNILLTVTMYIQ